MAPIDRIKQALKDEAQRARFDRGLHDLASVLVEAINTNANVAPEFTPRIHDGDLVEVGLNVRRAIR